MDWDTRFCVNSDYLFRDFVNIRTVRRDAQCSVWFSVRFRSRIQPPELSLSLSLCVCVCDAPRDREEFCLACVLKDLRCENSQTLQIQNPGPKRAISFHFKHWPLSSDGQEKIFVKIGKGLSERRQITGSLKVPFVINTEMIGLEVSRCAGNVPGYDACGWGFSTYARQEFQIPKKPHWCWSLSTEQTILQLGLIILWNLLYRSLFRTGGQNFSLNLKSFSKIVVVRLAFQLKPFKSTLPLQNENEFCPQKWGQIFSPFTIFNQDVSLRNFVKGQIN